MSAGQKELVGTDGAPAAGPATEIAVKAQVRQFYDSIGWRQIGEGLYQNARYEDLRPVSRGYLHRCHRRVARFLPRRGVYLLDAGSGPIQYPEYLEYSQGYRYRVCLDLSRRALLEARQRIGDRGLYVVGDLADLPFRERAFEGVVSLHAVHHLPLTEQEAAFRSFLRVLRPGGRSAVVYTWGDASPLMRLSAPLVRAANGLLAMLRRLRRGRDGGAAARGSAAAEELLAARGTHTFRHDYNWIRDTLADLPGLEIRVWRTASTAFLRALIHGPLLGALWLRVLYQCEEWAPRLLGRLGQYPLIVFERPGAERLD
jgi:SAM-dependent methyltransferase